MLRILVFEMLQLGVSAFAILRGGAPERLAGWMLLAAALTSLATGMLGTSQGLSVPILAVDGVLLAGLAAIALRANRFWPYWASALQLVAIGVHGARALDPTLLPIVYSRVTGQIAYPMLLVLAIGTYHYVRRTRLQGVAPRPWATFRW